MAKSSRIFNVMQYERHPVPTKPEDFEPEDMDKPEAERRGRLLLTPERVQEAIDKHKSIKQWAWVYHDRDVYSEQDEIDDAAGRKHAGDRKPAHFHIVLRSDSAIDVDTIARWFGIPMQYVQIPAGGRRAFMDCVEYLTHESDKEQAKGKFLYGDDDVHASFDFREALNERAENADLEGMTAKQRLRLKVRTGVLTLDEAFEKHPVEYMDDIDRLRKLRTEFLQHQPPPAVRVNYYISGRGGVGKGLLARALARALFPDMDDADLFFEVGGKNVPFEGYRGQPVLIWADWRAGDFLREFGGRGRVFQLFEPHPGAPITVNVKGSSVVLTNPVNIVASEPTPADFLDGLAGEYVDRQGKQHQAEDKGQATRRWPILIPMHESDFDIYLNRGWLDDSADFQEYVGFRTVAGNMRKVREQLSSNAEMVAQIEGRMMGPVIEAHRQILPAPKEITAEVVDEFAGYGAAEALDAGRRVEIAVLEARLAAAQADEAEGGMLRHYVRATLPGGAVLVDAAGRFYPVGPDGRPAGTAYSPAESDRLRAPKAIP